MRIRINFTDYGQYIIWKDVEYVRESQDEEGRDVFSIGYRVAGGTDEEPRHREQNYVREGVREILAIPDPKEIEEE